MGITSFFCTDILSNIPTFAVNETGEVVQTGGTLYDITGRIRPMTGDEIIASDKLNIISSHVLYCSVGSQVTDDSVITYENSSYVVTYIKDPMNMKHHLEIWMKQIA